MTELIKKYFNIEDIEKYITVSKMDSQALNIVIDFFERAINDFIEDGIMEVEQEDCKNYILTTSKKLAIHFENQRKLGYSHAWCLQYAEKMCHNEDNKLLGWCFDAANDADPILAENDLLLYCKLKNADNLFIEKFVKWMKDGEGFANPDAEEQAEEFSKTYKKQKELGKSDVYASQYANLASTFQYHKIYIEEYAFIYDQSISEGKDEQYATVYADKYADNVVDIKRRAGISDDEEMLEYVKLEALAYVKGWDYARKNIQGDKQRFIKIFVQHYLGLCFPDVAEDWVGFDKLDEVALKGALEEFN